MAFRCLHFALALVIFIPAETHEGCNGKGLRLVNSAATTSGSSEEIDLTRYSGPFELIPDANAKKPETWDDDEDGQWERPMIRVPRRRKPQPWDPLFNELQSSYEEACPWLLIGLACTALLKAFFPSQPSTSAASTSSSHVGSVLKGAFWGLLSPLCSCSALPIAMSLARSGSGAPAAVAFIIASQSAGVDSLVFTLGILGLRPALLRLLAAGLLAVIAGLAAPMSSLKQASASAATKTIVARPLLRRVYEAFVETFNADFEELAPWLVVSYIITAIIAVGFPDGGLAHTAFLGGSIARGAVLAVALPLQFCEHSAVPLALALQNAGASGGLAFAFLATLPAINLGSAAIILQLAGIGGTVRVILAVWLSGFLGSYVADELNIKVLDAGDVHELLPEWFVAASKSIVVALALLAFIRYAKKLDGAPDGHVHEGACCNGKHD